MVGICVHREAAASCTRLLRAASKSRNGPHAGASIEALDQEKEGSADCRRLGRAESSLEGDLTLRFQPDADAHRAPSFRHVSVPVQDDGERRGGTFLWFEYKKTLAIRSYCVLVIDRIHPQAGIE